MSDTMTEFRPGLDARIHAATKVNATPEHLEKAATDEDAPVRVRVALHSSTPEKVRRALATDGDVRVRWAVASTDLTPVDVLKSLAEDSDSNVAGIALSTLTAN